MENYELDDLLMKVRPWVLACFMHCKPTILGIVNDARTSKCRSLIFLFRMQLPIVSQVHKSVIATVGALRTVADLQYA